MGLALKRSGGFAGRIVGVSRSETIETALEMGVIDEGWGYDEMAQALAGADLVFICTPIQRIIEQIEQVAELVPDGAIVTDVGSTKRRIVARAAECFRAGTYFVGGHPMAGSEKAGVTAADPFLFQNAIYILVPDVKVPRDRYDALIALLRSVGARVLELAAEEHDEAVASISHLPQIMATTLVEMVGKLNEDDDHFLPLAAGGFRDMTRIASSPFAPVWQDIYATNADQVRAMIDRYMAVLQDARERLEDGSLVEDFSYANRVRGSIPRDAKGFIHVLYEILVVAEDKPGVIAEIATALEGEGININDIEVMKVREGEGGTLRLGFDSDEAAGRALVVLEGIGYGARRP
jgi:prephenate dehydrogenase